MVEDYYTKEIRRTLKMLKKAYREIKDVRKQVKDLRDRVQVDSYDQTFREICSRSVNMNDFYRVNEILDLSANLLKPCITRLLPANEKKKVVTVAEMRKLQEQAKAVRRSNSNAETWVFKSYISLIKNSLKHKFFE